MAGPAAVSGQGGDPAGKPQGRRSHIGSLVALHRRRPRETWFSQPRQHTQSQQLPQVSSKPARRLPSPPAVLSQGLPPPTSPRTLHCPLWFPPTLPMLLAMRPSPRSPQTSQLEPCWDPDGQYHHPRRGGTKKRSIGRFIYCFSQLELDLLKNIN